MESKLVARLPLKDENGVQEDDAALHSKLYVMLSSQVEDIRQSLIRARPRWNRQLRVQYDNPVSDGTDISKTATVYWDE